VEINFTFTDDADLLCLSLYVKESNTTAKSY
jgi:hypothetical protein